MQPRDAGARESGHVAPSGASKDARDAFAAQLCRAAFEHGGRGRQGGARACAKHAGAGQGSSNVWIFACQRVCVC